jgi:hypothetical protein
MRTIANPLAILLSFLMATTSLSASACDLSCWLHVAHSSCPIAGPRTASKIVAVSSMPVGTSMSSHHCGSLAGIRTADAREHSVPSATGTPLALVKYSTQTAPTMNAGDGPGMFSSCTQEAYCQPSVSTFPRKIDSSQTVSQAAEIRILSRVSPLTLRSGTLESPPSGVLAADCPLTNLRI